MAAPAGEWLHLRFEKGDEFARVKGSAHNDQLQGRYCSPLVRCVTAAVCFWSLSIRLWPRRSGPELLHRHALLMQTLSYPLHLFQRTTQKVGIQRPFVRFVNDEHVIPQQQVQAIHGVGMAATVGELTAGQPSCPFYVQRRV